MDRRRLINVINIGIVLMCFIIDFALGIIFNFDYKFYISTVLFVGGIGVVNLVFIAIKEACILSYDSNKYDYIFNAIFSFLGVLAYYTLKYLNGYDKYSYLYWVVFICLIVISAIVYFILGKFKKTNDDKPKFIVKK